MKLFCILSYTMEVQQQLILTACIVNFGLTSVQPHVQMADQAITSKVNDESQVRENFQNLFHSIASNDTKNSEIHCGILKEELSRVRQAFDTLKDELKIVRNRNFDRKRNFFEKNNFHENMVAVKRETNENKLSTGIGSNSRTRAYIDEKGFYRDPLEEETLRYDRVHVYRGLLFNAQERLVLSKACIQDVIIDWEILRDEGILVKEFDKLVDNMEKRLDQEIAHVDTVMQVNPRTAKIIQPVNQSSIEEISKHFQGLICSLEERKPKKYARDRFEEIISRLKAANDELIDTFRNVTTSIADMKRKHNV